MHRFSFNGSSNKGKFGTQKKERELGFWNELSDTKRGRVWLRQLREREIEDADIWKLEQRTVCFGFGYCGFGLSLNPKGEREERRQNWEAFVPFNNFYFSFSIKIVNFKVNNQ